MQHRQPWSASQRTPLFIALLLAFALRAAWIALFGGQPAFDARTYFEIAQRLASHLEYTYDGRPTAYWPVGYPGTLSGVMRVFGAGLTSAWILNLLSGLGALLCTHSIALQLGLGPRVANRAVLLGAINPVCISYSSLVVTETWFVFLMLLGIAVGIARDASRTRLLVSGAVLGCASLTRPLGLMLPLLLGFGAVRLRGGLRLGCLRTLWVGVGLLLAMIPWWTRNALAFDAFVPVATNGGVNLYIGNNPYADGRYRFEAFQLRALGADTQSDFMGGPREVVFDRTARQHALRNMQAHPLETAALWPRKLLYTYLPDLTGLTWNIAPASPTSRAVLPVVPLLIALHEAALLVVALIGSLRLRRRLLLPGALVAGLTLVSLVYFGMPRFHFPMFPWLELYAAAAFARFAEREPTDQWVSPCADDP